MKKLFAMICAVMMTALLLCSCTQSAKNEMISDVTEFISGAETLASEVKDNLDGMIDNGTVSDGDGFLDENKYEDDDRTETVYDSTDGISTDHGNIDESTGGLFDSDNGMSSSESR